MAFYKIRLKLNFYSKTPRKMLEILQMFGLSYLKNNISLYLGKGQVASSTMFSSLSTL